MPVGPPNILIEGRASFFLSSDGISIQIYNLEYVLQIVFSVDYNIKHFMASYVTRTGSAFKFQACEYQLDIDI